jgi:hypothetical protein
MNDGLTIEKLAHTSFGLAWSCPLSPAAPHNPLEYGIIESKE